MPRAPEVWFEDIGMHFLEPRLWPTAQIDGGTGCSRQLIPRSPKALSYNATKWITSGIRQSGLRLSATCLWPISGNSLSFESVRAQDSSGQCRNLWSRGATLTPLSLRVRSDSRCWDRVPAATHLPSLYPDQNDHASFQAVAQVSVWRCQETTG